MDKIYNLLKIKNRNNLKKLSEHVRAEKFYHNNHSKLIILTSKKDLIWHVPERMIFIDKYFKEGKSRVFLDIGCGSAENIRKNIFPKMSSKDIYIGVDISKKLLKKAKQNIPHGIFLKSPMENLEIPKKTIDYISFFGALHHGEYPEKSLKKILKFLKPKGFLFLREPTEKAFKKGLGATKGEAGINPSHLRRWLDESNMEILGWHYLNIVPFHQIRRALVKLGLGKWEEIEFLWEIKVLLELFIERLTVGPLGAIRGTDMFIVARKKTFQ